MPMKCKRACFSPFGRHCCGYRRRISPFKSDSVIGAKSLTHHHLRPLLCLLLSLTVISISPLLQKDSQLSLSYIWSCQSHSPHSQSRWVTPVAVDRLTWKYFHTCVSESGVRGPHVFGPMSHLKCATQFVASVLFLFLSSACCIFFVVVLWT